MSKVIIKTSSYDYSALRPDVFAILDRLAPALIKRNSPVLIKPNFLAPARPEHAITTHPLVLRAVAEYVLDKGGRPVISDSQAMGSFSRVLKTGGYQDALKGLDVEFREFRKSVPINIGEPFGRVEIAEDALRAGVTINLPKFKTHCQMLLTLGVKNLFGCVVGLRKPEWHLRAGIDREMFARLIVRIYASLKPSVTLLDGILAMEGQGPGRSGLPRELNILAGSDNAVALDMAVCRVLGIPSDMLLTNKMAAEAGLAEDFTIEGEWRPVEKFRLPLMVPLVFGPKRFHKFLRKYLVQRPVADPSLCRACGECWKICPARAIAPEHSYVRFDYEKCIRCYCCIEVCPYAALKTSETLSGKLFRKLIRS